ncbi:MAG: hypothetical protein CVT63_06915 [Candidatus Anoxymicrobium japonicum]|uniref:DUF501 domain-containing protein n=1 Tax=Candidatus Anoxymicrobium japonicum TaxID=2013648 RepID=A0A2N3G4K2_9ACTN|nr:MAG: hypothetical protein CVT63_06915 [Candidatus Anoxymicrobium japonicum]
MNERACQAASLLERLAPPFARAVFPGLELPGARDEDLVCRQIGRRCQGRILISCRCPRGRPAVILTLPLEGEGGSAPPLLWLTCPHAAARVGTLESTGESKRIAARLKSDQAASVLFAQDEERFSVLQESLARLVSGELAGRVRKKGAAGGRVGAVKCLHAHLAYRLSACPESFLSPPGERVGGDRGPAIIGRWCQELLAREDGNWCERPPAACVT